MKKIAILGSTGSIGTQTLDVAAANPERIRVVALAAHKNDALLEAQIRKFQPLVAAQWHPTKNAPLEPDEILPGSSKRVWWRCTDGHEWKAAVYSRTGAKKCGCPVCAGKPPRQYP